MCGRPPSHTGWRRACSARPEPLRHVAMRLQSRRHAMIRRRLSEDQPRVREHRDEHLDLHTPSRERIGRMGAVTVPVDGHLVVGHMLQTRGHVQLRRAQRTCGRTPGSYRPSPPHARWYPGTRTTAASPEACDTRPCAPHTRRGRAAGVSLGMLPRAGEELAFHAPCRSGTPAG